MRPCACYSYTVKPVYDIQYKYSIYCNTNVSQPFRGRGTLRVTMWNIQVRRNRSFLSTYAEGPRVFKGIKLPHNVHSPG